RTRRAPERHRASALEATHVPRAGLRHGREPAAIRATESAPHKPPDSCADHGTLFAGEGRPGASAIGSATCAGADGPADTSRRVTPLIHRRRPRAREGRRWTSNANTPAIFCRSYAAEPDVLSKTLAGGLLTSFLVFSAMGGVMRAILEGGAPPKMVRSLQKQLVLLCRGFLMPAAV